MQVDYPKGDPDNPLTWEEATNKFMNLVTPVYGVTRANKICKMVEHLEEYSDMALAITECLKEI